MPQTSPASLRRRSGVERRTDGAKAPLPVGRAVHGFADGPKPRDETSGSFARVHSLDHAVRKPFVRKVLSALVGAILGFFLGTLVGTLCRMLWIWVFPANHITSGPKAGLNTAFGAGLSGEPIGIIVGVILGLQRRATKAKHRGVDER